MPLRDQALLDIVEIMNDTDTGGVPITITSPAGESLPFNALESDIFLSIDPGTQEMITGRQVHASVLIAELIATGFSDIRGEEDSAKKPWVVQTTDGFGRAWTFKVVETRQVNSRGLMPLILECYEPLE